MKRYIQSTTNPLIKCTGIASEHMRSPSENRYCTYAWVETKTFGEFCVAFIDSYNAKVVKEPVWGFIKDERTPKLQKFINDNYDAINKACVDYYYKYEA